MPRELDLRYNPMLHIIGAGDLVQIGTALQSLRLPANLNYLSNETIALLPQLSEITFEEKGDIPVNVMTEGSDFFGDVCCGMGESVAGVAFCDLQLRMIGSDTIFHPFGSYPKGDIIVELRPSSNFMSEAAESPEKCAEYCKNTPECTFFEHDARIKESEHSCRLYRDEYNMEMTEVCCEFRHYADENQTIPGLTAGVPPRSRYKFENSRVLLQSREITLDPRSNYVANYSVSLGTNPLRGAVWIEPQPASEDKVNLRISPSRVALYDNLTTAFFTVSMEDTQKVSRRGEAIILVNSVTSCDTAFSFFSDPSDYTVVVSVLATNDSRVLLSSTIVGSLLALVIVFSAWCAVKHIKKQANKLWAIDKEQLILSDPLQVIGRGTSSEVVLAEYRGTEVAVKRLLPVPLPEADGSDNVVMEPFPSRRRQLEKVSSVRESISMKPLKWNMGEFGKMASQVTNSLEDEIRLLATLRHPNIATIIGTRCRSSVVCH